MNRGRRLFAAGPAQSAAGAGAEIKTAFGKRLLTKGAIFKGRPIAQVIEEPEQGGPQDRFGLGFEVKPLKGMEEQVINQRVRISLARRKLGDLGEQAGRGYLAQVGPEPGEILEQAGRFEQREAGVAGGAQGDFEVVEEFELGGESAEAFHGVFGEGGELAPLPGEQGDDQVGFPEKGGPEDKGLGSERAHRLRISWFEASGELV